MPAKPSRSEQLADRRDADAFQLLVESTIDYAIFMLDAQGCVISWNPGAERIKGYTASDIIGRHFSTFYTPESLAIGWPRHELEVAARVGRFEDEGWRVRKDGSRFWANVIITALRNPDGSLRGFAKVTRDLSQRKAQEERVEKLARELEQRVEELAAVNRQLAQKNAENESFVYSVSHDLRSPLVNLQGFSQELALTAGSLKTLLQSPEVPERIQREGLALLDVELQESIGFIRNAVKQLGNIIDGLLRLSRVGRIEYQHEHVDVGSVVADIMAAMHSSIVRSGARIEVGPMPVIEGDRGAIGQIFANVIGNALSSFDPSRPGLVQISASGGDPPVFAIRDNGIGIPPDYQSKIFQVFQHVHKTERHGEGLGLAIVQRIVERHGGRIWFESVPNQGTTFFFTLPGPPPRQDDSKER